MYILFLASLHQITRRSQSPFRHSFYILNHQFAQVTSAIHETGHHAHRWLLWKYRICRHLGGKVCQPACCWNSHLQQMHIILFIRQKAAKYLSWQFGLPLPPSIDSDSSLHDGLLSRRALHLCLNWAALKVTSQAQLVEKEMDFRLC